MRKFATFNASNIARHRLQVELWRKRKDRRMGDSGDDKPVDPVEADSEIDTEDDKE